MKPPALVVVLGGTVLVIVVTNEVTSMRFWGRTPACASWPASMAKTSEIGCMKLENLYFRSCWFLLIVSGLVDDDIHE